MIPKLKIIPDTAKEEQGELWVSESRLARFTVTDARGFRVDDDGCQMLVVCSCDTKEHGRMLELGDGYDWRVVKRANGAQALIAIRKDEP